MSIPVVVNVRILTETCTNDFQTLYEKMERNIINRINKLETYANLIKEEVVTLRQQMGIQASVNKKTIAIKKVAATAVARRNARLIKK